VEIDKDIEMDSDLIEKLQNIAHVSDEHDFPENLPGSSSFRWEAQIGHAFPEEIVVNPRFPMAIPRNRRESDDSCDKPAMLIGNPSFLIRFLEN